LSVRRAAYPLLAFFGLLAACKTDARPTSSTGAPASSSSAANRTPTIAFTTHDEVHAGIRFIVTFRGGADDRAPLVVGMHGRGGKPERFAGVFQNFDGRAEIAFAQAPSKWNDGWSWFPEWHGDDDPAFVAAFDAAEKQLWQAIMELSRGRRVIVTGFSQGGILSYVLAARHPREIAYAFPIGGAAPPGFLPHDRQPTAPVYALHGAIDQVIDVGAARSTIAAFKEQGAKAELHEFPGVDHDMPAELRADLMAHVREVTDAADR
jgi:phospholipase/carboxylesterase